MFFNKKPKPKIGFKEALKNEGKAIARGEKDFRSVLEPPVKKSSGVVGRGRVRGAPVRRNVPRGFRKPFF